jgi:hypothetical protein
VCGQEFHLLLSRTRFAVGPCACISGHVAAYLGFLLCSVSSLGLLPRLPQLLLGSGQLLLGLAAPLKWSGLAS